MNIAVIGTGFVGVVSAAVYASFGNKVYGIDIDAKKIETLKNSSVPFYEPDLEKLLKEQQATGNLLFTTEYSEVIPQVDVIIIAVGTPSNEDGQVNLEYVYAACKSLSAYLKENTIIVLKSTVPPGTCQSVSDVIKANTNTPFSIASVPEFLKEGTAVHDTLNPDRVVIGTDNNDVFNRLAELHKPLHAPTLHVSIESAQMAKYTANAYLATRITFINEIADICETNKANIEEVISVIGYDKRIGSHYWYPGLGYGGSCFPKDVKELAAYSRSVALENNLFNNINRINEDRIPRILATFEKEVEGFENKKIAVLGLAFKPNTDDMREAPSLKVIPYLLERGAIISTYDPKATEIAKTIIPESDKLFYNQSVESAIADCDVIIALIEWNEIITFPFTQYAHKPGIWFFDVRNQFDKDSLESAGFLYKGIGK